VQRPGANPDDMQASDFLCDFCLKAWDGESPVVEGHRGSLICGECLAVAYRALVLGADANAPAGYSCVLCLETRDEPGWTGTSGAAACRRCVKQSAGVLGKSKDYQWVRPV
jgi:hypothetical protein